MPSSEASASPFSAFTSAIVTIAPRSCSARAVASPSPEAPPATIALEPSICTAASLLAVDASREGQRKQLVGIGQPAHQLQPRGREVALEALRRELGADLSAQLLAGVEVHG